MSVTLHHRPPSVSTRKRVHRALDTWPSPDARRALVESALEADLNKLRGLGYALARCGRGRRAASDEFLERYEDDRRLNLRTLVLYGRLFYLDDEPREAVKEVRRAASYPGKVPWPAVMDALNHLWATSPREMFRLMPSWLTHRDPWRRWAALHGLELPARSEPREVLKVLRLLRGERHLRVRRLLGHVIGQGLYPWHPEPAVQEMARWLREPTQATGPIIYQVERQLELWFGSGLSSKRQAVRLGRVARYHLDHRTPDVRAHARRILKSLDE